MTFKRGLKDGIPIALGYFAVSFAFGVYCTTNGLPVILSTIISLTNLTSAGQFAGVNLILENAMYIEILLAVLLINLRYSLMSISLTQKLDKNCKRRDKLIFGFGITDEVFAIANTRKSISSGYMYGLILLPIVGWTIGTLCGSLSQNLLPERVLDAFGISLYAMFVAIIIPDCRRKLSVLFVVIVAAGLSVMFYYVPYVKDVPLGFQIIICTIIAAILGALLFPIKDDLDVSSD